MNELEGNVIQALNDKGLKNFPRLKMSCVFNSKPTLIMEQMGPSLTKFLNNYPNGFSFKTV